MAQWLARRPACNFQGVTPDARYSSVPLECCDGASWDDDATRPSQGTVASITASNMHDGDYYTCPVMKLGFFGYVRGNLNCRDKGNGAMGMTWAEGCVPADIDPHRDWPMNETLAETKWEKGTYSSCHCEEKEVAGSSCWVGKAFPGTAFFFRTDDSQCQGGSALLNSGEKDSERDADLPAAPTPKKLSVPYVMLTAAGSDRSDNGPMAQWLARRPACNFQGVTPDARYSSVPLECCDGASWDDDATRPSQGTIASITASNMHDG